MFESIEDTNPNSHIIDQDEEEEPSISLDENGFPNEYEHQKLHENSNGSSKDDTFAADFYRCGTDWTSLSLKQESKCDSSKKMKQKDLFQMWGIKKQKIGEVEENEEIIVKKDDVKVNHVVGGGGVDSGLSLIGSSSRDKLFDVGTPFTVDAFRYGSIRGCSAYFLTHFHADHYGGLSKGWSHGRIYCTPITARLVRMCLYVNPSFIYPLELDVEHDIDGVKVTLLEANHCPGAALIHFHLRDGQHFLHTGDFRACRHMQTYPLLVDKQVDILYLDTTYCNPKYRFPSKEEVASFVVKTTKACLKRQPRTLIIVGAYSIGKESVYIAISEALKVRIYANASRRRILQSFDWPHLSKSLCSDGKDTPLHVLPMSSLRHEFLKPRKIIATVNISNAASREKQQSYFKQWLSE
ncbi:hypothetical protein KSS87_006815 [Heliosperma pusillum]|nr:hypothetical protein KSS87_006815 [Heliosperma pusillum]